MTRISNPETAGFLAGRLNVGGVWYFRDQDVTKIPGLSAEDLAHYKSRGLINTRRVGDGGSRLAHLAMGKPVAPMTTENTPIAPPASNPVAPAPAPAPAEAPSGPAGPADVPGETHTGEAATEEVSEAARLMAERQERARNAIGARKAKA